jgi:hypothetical protein
MVELSDRQRLRGGFRSKMTSSSFGPFFKRTRDNSNSLHDILKNGWSCCCKVSHKVLLQLERKVDEGDDDFKVLCCIPTDPNSTNDEVCGKLITNKPSIMQSYDMFAD